MNLLQHLLVIAASPQCGSIIRIQKNIVLITNQYRFFWNVLPKFAKIFIPKNKFIQQIKKYNFVQITNMKQINFDNSQNRDKFLMLQAPRRFIQLITIVSSIRDKGLAERECLKMKAQKIKKLIQQQSQKEGNQMLKSYQLLQAISSLKQINRKVFNFQNQLAEIANSVVFSQFQSSENTQNMLDFDTQKTSFKRKAYPYYTCNHFHN